KIYLDDPGWRVFFNGLNALYHNNPVRIDIAGTTESIQQIDENLLYRCYNTFYNLNNMVLSIAGRFDPDEALAICDELLKKSEDKGLSVIIPEEPEEVKEKRIVQQLYCAVPLFQLGFKKKNYEEREARRQYIIHNIMLEAALGDFSPFYSRLYDSGLINDTFSLGVTMGRGFFIPMASGESRDPDKVCEELKQELSRLKKEGIPKESFDIVKKMTYGELLSGFGTVANVAKGAMNAQFGGINLYDNLETAASVSYEDVMTALRELDLENSSLSIIEPPEKKGEAGNV
ncbi:MAG: M16 family metallopeptidase, partial [Ruminiclostridium sp.]